MVSQIDGNVWAFNRNCFLTAAIQNIDSDCSTIVMHNFCMILLIAQFHEVAMMRPFLWVGMIVVVVCPGTG
ncbi:MAG: hypothetical protein C0478_16455 [Planctomyces sp.]|nr:hypothetical protein [Planctomyces sp.]